MTGSEAPALRLRDKSAVVGWTFQNLSAFIVTFTVPYLIDDGYAGLHSKLGFIYGAIGALGLIWAFFCFPELKGRSLEEIDEMFLANVPARKFRGKLNTLSLHFTGVLKQRMLMQKKQIINLLSEVWDTRLQNWKTMVVMLKV